MATHMIDSGRIKAAGALLWRDGAHGPEIALIHRERYDDWSFPKGKAEPGEHALVTALREVQEETGHRAVFGRRLPNTEYEVLGRPKRVRYWAGRSVEEVEFTPNEEVDRLEWFGPEAAAARLTNPLDHGVLEVFLAAPAHTFPVILQRHAKAEHRGPLYRDDLARPLAPHGRQQALSLAELLAGYGRLRVVSSPAVRCVATVRPYTDLRALTLETDAALTEQSYVHAPRAVVAWLKDLVARREGTVVCTHGPLLDELIAAVLYSPDLGGSVRLDDGPTLQGKPWDPATADQWANESIAPGGAWVLHFAVDTDRTGLVAVDKLKP
ncbi:NUDIX hydrolase [Actinospica durhamensis]|uniref:NUDIX hydrolase n=1 Tax=Actinospica durhamensis TaxID=1508375 RepID=A0A941IPX5_9ACTN|nr:NUDIX hydrolase [Actinospica durhamensis]MBR7833592.1 NUDIX hydrolase [Actinospica durhamensis]